MLVYILFEIVFNHLFLIYFGATFKKWLSIKLYEIKFPNKIKYLCNTNNNSSYVSVMYICRICASGLSSPRCVYIFPISQIVGQNTPNFKALYNPYDDDIRHLELCIFFWLLLSMGALEWKMMSNDGLVDTSFINIFVWLCVCVCGHLSDNTRTHTYKRTQTTAALAKMRISPLEDTQYAYIHTTSDIYPDRRKAVEWV